MKKTINKLFLCTIFSIYGNYAIAENIVHGTSENIVEYTIDLESTPYQLALENGMDFNEFNRINDMKFKSDDILNVGQIIKLPALSKMAKKNNQKLNNINENTELNSTLPNLGHSANLNEQQNSAVNTALNYTGVTPFTTGNSDENTSKLAIAAATTDWEQLSIKKMTDETLNRIENDVKNQVTSQVTESVESFLGQFGKAEVVLSVDDEGNLAGSSLNVLSPIYDQGQNLIFTQAGVHGQGSGSDARTIGNFGVGYRYDTESWLVGANTFIDHDFTGANTRLGLGAEYWRDNLKLATNVYTPLSNWKESSVMKDYEALIYDERPARGFDIRAKAYLPNYPQLGGSLAFEQYYGNEVALFGTEERQKDPYAVTIGLNYTPIPLITTELTHKTGKSSAEESQVNVNLNLQLGTPIEEQLDPANVSVARSLKGSRYDMVDRNYDIVFEYKKEDFQIAISGPDEAQLGTNVTLDSSVQSRSAIQSYEWIVTDRVGNPVSIMDNQNKSITFKIQKNFDHYVRLKVVTQRGYEAVSEPRLIKVLSAQSLSTLENKEGQNVQKRLIDFATTDLVFYAEAFDLPKSDRHVLTFTAKDYQGNDFDLTKLSESDLQISWRLNGAREFLSMDGEDNRVKIFRTPGDAPNKLNIVVVADETLLSSFMSGTAAVDIAVSTVQDLTVFGMTTLNFYKGDFSALMINPSNIKIEIVEISSTRKGRNSFETLVSESGIDNNQVILNQRFAPITSGASYETRIWTKENDSTAWTNVTERFVDSIIWLYWDPITAQEISTDEPFKINNGKKYAGLEGCYSSNTFITQTNNYVNNELAWGEILTEDLGIAKKNISKRVLTEQGLRLAVQFDFTTPNKPKDLANTQCQLDDEASPDYTGKDGSNFKANAWIGN